jgi:hypothetical protein
VLRPEEENPEDELAEDDADEAPAFLEEGGADDGTVVEEEEINSDFEGVDVEESLKDSVEGSLRLKRLLSRDDDLDGGEKKRRRGFEESEKPEFKLKVNMLLGRWGLLQDKVCKHVLDSLTLDELTELAATNYSPDKYNNWKSPPELLAKHTNELRERKMINNHSVDRINAFKFRWKISSEAEKILRTMDHKSLRYVLENHDGVKPIEDTMKEGVLFDAEEAITEHAIPNNPGPTTMSRFHRLELIDPLAAAAVFGDANLTFALRLASHRKALGHVGRVIATTFEELETLRERYHEIDESVKTLEDMFCEVYHGVDCTRIAIDSRFKELEGTLGAAYYNFPHSGAIQGFFDGHPCVNWRHENLMRLFFRALRSYIKPGGIVKVASNASAVGVRYSYIVGGAIENEFIHTETVPFLEWHLHRYGRSYGDKRDVYKRPDAQNNQSYNAQRAEADMVYCFAYAPTGKPMPPQAVRLPPSLKTLTACVDGPFTKTQGQGRINLARQLHKRFVTEVSGTHVG